jgi:hypothetical protein
MSSGHTSKNRVKAGTAQAVGASATKQVVSDVFRIENNSRKEFRADATAASTTSSSGITLILQTSHDGSTWVDGKSTTISGDGNITVNYLPNVAGDQAYLPLRPLGRFVVTTGSGDAVTISALWVAETP